MIGVVGGADWMVPPNDMDYNPQNNVYKIADFGLSKLLQSDWNSAPNNSILTSPRGGNAKLNIPGSGLSTQSVVGSMSYISPEASKGYWYKAPTDIWSLGCILFELLTLMIAQKDLKVLITMSRNFVRQTMESLKLHHRYSSKVMYILENCLRLDPMSRISAKQILTVLHLHPAQVNELLMESRQFDEESSALIEKPMISAEAQDEDKEDDPSVDRMFHSGSSVGNMYQKVLFNQDSLHLFRLKRPVATKNDEIEEGLKSNGKFELTYPLLERHNVEKLVHYLIFCENPTRKLRNSATFPYRKYYDQFHNLVMRTSLKSRTKKNMDIIDRITMTDASFFDTNDDDDYDSLTDDNTTTTTWVHDDEDDDDDSTIDLGDKRSSQGKSRDRKQATNEGAEAAIHEEGGDLLLRQNTLQSIDPLEAEHIRKKHRRHQRTLFLTLHYFTNPVVILKNLIDIARRPPADNLDLYAMQEQCLQCIVSWVNNGNLCYDYNITISKLLRYTLRIQIQNNATFAATPTAGDDPISLAELERSLHDKRMRLLSKNLRSTLMTKLTKMAETKLQFGLNQRAHNNSFMPKEAIKEIGRDRTSLTNVSIMRKLREIQNRPDVRPKEDDDEMQFVDGDEEDGYNSDNEQNYDLAGLPAIMTYNETEIVEQMTLIDQDMFKQIKPFEWSRVQLMNLNNDLEHRYDHSPNILRTINRFNRLGRWVCTCIIRERVMERRVALIAKFLRMVDALFNKYRNLNTTKAILFGLNYSSVQRLQETWEELKKKYPKEYKSFQTITAILESNESTDRIMSIDLEKFDKIEEKGTTTTQAQKEIDAILGNPCVPFIGIYLSLLKTIEVDEYSFLDEVLEHDTREVINMPKFERMADCIREIQLHQRKDYYNIAKITPLFNKLKSIEVMSVVEEHSQNLDAILIDDDTIYSDNLLYLDSLLLEPSIEKPSSHRRNKESKSKPKK